MFYVLHTYSEAQPYLSGNYVRSSLLAPTPLIPHNNLSSPVKGHLQTKTLVNTMASQDMVRTRRLLGEDPTAKWGFIVYRCTYESDDEWVRFMQYLNTSVRTGLERDGDGDLFDRIDWQVQDDQEQFDRAASSKLRR